MTRVVSLVGLVGALLSAAPVAACSEPACQNGFLVPSGRARVPANAPGFWWRASRDRGAGEPSAVHVWQLGQPPGQVPLVVTQVAHSVAGQPLGVLLSVPLVAGQQLLVEAADTCAIGGQRPFSAQVEVTPEQPFPTRLGTLHASALEHAPQIIASRGGGCSREADAVSIEVSIELDSGAAPWADLLLYETVVDGALYAPSASSIYTPPPHESWLGRGQDRLVLLCDRRQDDTVGLSAGTHRVQLAARLPGRDLRVVSDTLTLDLVCPAVAEAAPADQLYDAVSYQTGALVVSAQLALLLYFMMTRRRRRRAP